MREAEKDQDVLNIEEEVVEKKKLNQIRIRKAVDHHGALISH